MHLVSFDTERFAQFDAHDAPKWGLGCSDAIARSAPRRQAEFFYGRWAARSALLAQGMPRMQIGSGLTREPLWPYGVVGSITHVAGLAAAALAPAARLVGLGLDIEPIAVGEAQSALRSLVVDATELALLRSLGANDLDFWVTTAFSAKESFFKAAFPTMRRFFDFGAVRVAAVDSHRKTLCLQIIEPLADPFRLQSLWEVDFDLLDAGIVLTGLLARADPMGEKHRLP